MAKVSKLKGLRSNVIGNSFVISTKANNPPAIIDFFMSGIDTRVIVFENDVLRVLLAQFKFVDILLKPDKVAP